VSNIDKSLGAAMERLFNVIESRRGVDPATSYTANLLKAGETQITRKIGEEAIEIILAALSGKKEDVTKESSDLLYHLMVLWANCGLTTEDIGSELTRREGTSGHDEKENRSNPLLSNQTSPEI
tara:strand:+ start:178 stop:549 length:372 start_codon:yes stop_codon:yes gene_type:complete